MIDHPLTKEHRVMHHGEAMSHHGEAMSHHGEAMSHQGYLQSEALYLIDHLTGVKYSLQSNDASPLVIDHQR